MHLLCSNSSSCNCISFIIFCYRQLLSKKKEATYEACDMAVKLNICKSKIFEYVESWMAFIAPNLSTIVEASMAVKIMGVFIQIYFNFKWKINFWKSYIPVLLIRCYQKFDKINGFYRIKSSALKLERLRIN